MINLWAWFIFFCLISIILSALYIRQALGVKRKLVKLKKRLNEDQERVREGLSSFESLRQLISDETNPKLGEAVHSLGELKARIGKLQSVIEDESPFPWYRSSAFHRRILDWAKEEQNISNQLHSELRLISNISKMNSYSKEKAEVVKQQLQDLRRQWQRMVQNTGLPLNKIGEVIDSLKAHLREAEEKHMYDAITSQMLVMSADMRRRQLERDLYDVRDYSRLILHYQRQLETVFHEEENIAPPLIIQQNEIQGDDLTRKGVCEEIYRKLLNHMSEGEMDAVRNLYKKAESCLVEAQQPPKNESDQTTALVSELKSMEARLQQIKQDRHELNESLEPARQKYDGIRFSEMDSKFYHLDSEIKHILLHIPKLYSMLKDNSSERERIQLMIELYNRKLQETEDAVMESNRWLQETEDQLVDLRRQFTSLEDKYVSTLISLSKQEIEIAGSRILTDRQEQITELLVEMHSLLTSTPYHLEKLRKSIRVTNEKLQEFDEEANRQIRQKEGAGRRILQIISRYNSMVSQGANIKAYESMSVLYEIQMNRIKELIRDGMFLEADRELDHMEDMLAGLHREYFSEDKKKNLNIHGYNVNG